MKTQIIKSLNIILEHYKKIKNKEEVAKFKMMIASIDNPESQKELFTDWIDTMIRGASGSESIERYKSWKKFLNC